jgi:tRNA A-37 threonylcarbamoyl transferase component Bud32
MNKSIITTTSNFNNIINTIPSTINNDDNNIKQHFIILFDVGNKIIDIYNEYINNDDINSINNIINNIIELLQDASLSSTSTKNEIFSNDISILTKIIFYTIDHNNHEYKVI